MVYLGKGKKNKNLGAFQCRGDAETQENTEQRLRRSLFHLMLSFVDASATEVLPRHRESLKGHLYIFCAVISSIPRSANRQTLSHSVVLLSQRESVKPAGVRLRRSAHI